MDPKHDQPNMGVNVHRRTTQLNLWMIVAVVVFFIAGGILIFRVMKHPPDTPQEMHNS